MTFLEEKREKKQQDYVGGGGAVTTEKKRSTKSLCRENSFHCTLMISILFPPCHCLYNGYLLVPIVHLSLAYIIFYLIYQIMCRRCLPSGVRYKLFQPVFSLFVLLLFFVLRIAVMSWSSDAINPWKNGVVLLSAVRSGAF